MISVGLRNYSKAELALSKIEMDTEEYMLSVRRNLKSLLCPSPMRMLESHLTMSLARGHPGSATISSVLGISFLPEAV